MTSFGYVLTRIILVSAVLLTFKFTIAGIYPFAAGLIICLLAYGYLVWWDNRSIDDRLLSPPR